MISKKGSDIIWMPKIAIDGLNWKNYLMNFKNIDSFSWVNFRDFPWNIIKDAISELSNCTKRWHL